MVKVRIFGKTKKNAEIVFIKCLPYEVVFTLHIFDIQLMCS